MRIWGLFLLVSSFYFSEGLGLGLVISVDFYWDGSALGVYAGH